METPLGGGRGSGARGAVRSSLSSLEVDLRLFGMVAALAVLWLSFNVLSDGLFLTPRNLWNLSVQSAAVAVMTTGMVLIIVSRNIDLSIGSTLGFTAMVMGLLQTEWIPDGLGLGLNMAHDVLNRGGYGLRVQDGLDVQVIEHLPRLS